MLRVFVPESQRDGSRIRITGAELRHLRALRLGRGARVLVFDDRGNEHAARIERLSDRAAEVLILVTHRPERESPFDLVLAPALLKGTKMDVVVEKATEIGVRRIAPVICRNGVATGARIERWQRIALAAAKQCGRTTLPAVDPPCALADVVRHPWSGLRLLAWEGEREHTLGALPGHATAAVVVVGPEGGFAPEEAEDARAHGFATLALGPRVLRAETAAIVAAALCQHRWGDLSPVARLR